MKELDIIEKIDKVVSEKSIRKPKKNRYIGLRLDNRAMKIVNQISYEENLSISSVLRLCINIMSVEKIRNWMFSDTDRRPLDELFTKKGDNINE